MPIQDYNGTNWSNIKNIQDYNGTNWSNMAKVHDYDGTAFHEIWSAEYEWFANSKYGQTTTWHTGAGWELPSIQSTGELKIQTQSGLQTLNTEQSFDVTEYSKAIINVTRITGTNRKIKIGLNTTWTDTPANYIIVNGTGTYTIDLSSVSGNKIFLTRPTYDSQSYGQTYISSILFVE